MTAQEQQMLQGLTERIANSPLTEKDDEAEQYLKQTLGRNPDALYMLSQTVLVQQYALEQAQKQLADAKSQLEAARQAPPPAPKHSGSFLGNLLGMNDEPKSPAPPPPPSSQYTPVPNSGSYYAQQSGAPQYAPPQYAQPQYAPQYGVPQYPPQGYAPPPQSGGFLRSAMTTATGVAAGALAFEGIESLMHGFGGGHSGGGGYGFEGGGNQGRPEEIINNYYGDASPNEHHGGGLGSDIEDRRNDTRGFADTTSDRDDVSTVDANSADNFDDTSTDASDDFSSDDSSNSDDSSSNSDDSNY